MNQEKFFKNSQSLGCINVKVDCCFNTGPALAFLERNPPKLDNYNLLPSLSVCFFGASSAVVKSTLEELDIQTESVIISRSNTTVWNCSEKQRLAHIPGKCYIINADGQKKDFIHVHGGYYLQLKSGFSHPMDIIKLFQKQNPSIYWGWSFIYNPSGYFVYPQCLIEDLPKEQPLTELQKRRQFKSVAQNHFENDVVLHAQNVTLKQLEDYCKNHSISYYALYASIGTICRYAFRVLNDDDVKYAESKSKTEGYLCWICASKESFDEFERDK